MRKDKTKFYEYCEKEKEALKRGDYKAALEWGKKAKEFVDGYTGK